MKILAIESSATACSVALCEDERLLAQSFQNNGLTHSVTLLPMLDQVLRGCGVELEDLVQEGFLGLYDAVEGYDWSQNANFLTYAGKWVRSKMVRYIQANGRGLRLPVNRRLPIDRRLLRIDRRLIIHRRLRGLVINRGAGRSRLLRRRCIR